MASVRIPLEMFTERRLPSVCARTGVVARDQYLLAARSRGADGPLIGAISLNGSVVRTISRLRRTAVYLFFASIAVISVALGTRSAVISVAASLLLALAIGLLLVISKNSVQATLDRDEIVLDRVHPAFVDAITKPRACDGCDDAGGCSVVDMDECKGASS